MLRVRYFAGAAAAAGLEEELVDVVPAGPAPATVADLRRELAARHPALGPVLEVATVLVAETAATATTPLPEPQGGAPAVVDLLPPFAGG